MQNTVKFGAGLETTFEAKLQELRGLLPFLFDADGALLEGELTNFCKQYSGEAGTERFTFEWAGKKQAKRHAFANFAEGALQLNEARSKNPSETSNIIIEGENLAVLHLLNKSYKNKVKCIYIDPPYNTGNDFVYNDKFELDVKTYLVLSGQVEAETGEQIAEYITKDDGRKHSKWLSFIYPRLMLARDLLREDGVIFISIDDNEQANLKLLMNEIFGEENFVGQITWRRTKNKSNQIKNMANVVDYILVYAKDKASLSLNKAESENTGYNYQDEKGLYSRNTILDKKRGKMNYEIITPVGNRLYGPWIIKEGDFKDMIEKNLIHWSDGKNETPYKKVYLEETGGLSVVDNFWDSRIYGSNQDGSLELEKLFQNNMIFDFPKPTSLIKKILALATQGGDLVLDFFAGSGTTAQAVMELNFEEAQKKEKEGVITSEEPSGGRRFILVQLPEKIDPKKEAFKAGYRHISEITLERVRRAGEKYSGVDTGFKTFELTENPEASGLFGLAAKPDEFILNLIALVYGYGLNYALQKLDFGNIYEVKSEFDDKTALVILEGATLSSQAISGLLKLSENHKNYTIFAKEACLNIEITYNLCNYFKKDNIVRI